MPSEYSGRDSMMMGVQICGIVEANERNVEKWFQLKRTSSLTISSTESMAEKNAA